MKKTLLILCIILVILVGAVFSVRFILGGSEDTWICVDNQWVKHGNPSKSQPTQGCGFPLVGGDRDEHGCIGSAGYSWCAEKQKCLRIWEEPCGK